MTESNRVEYKRELTDGLEKEVVAFLNGREGGLLYIGLDELQDILALIDTPAVMVSVQAGRKWNE